MWTLQNSKLTLKWTRRLEPLALHAEIKSQTFKNKIKEAQQHWLVLLLYVAQILSRSFHGQSKGVLRNHHSHQTEQILTRLLTFGGILGVERVADHFQTPVKYTIRSVPQ